MKIAIIADDLTGANDSGVQLAKYGLETSVLLQKSDGKLDEEAVVFDTDSRSIEKIEAYKRVEDVTKYLINENYSFIFKKIDSTMRGNIGYEVKSLLNQTKKDFVIVNPSYPSNGRQVINGNHYLNGKLLHETEIANDPLMPVKESNIPKLLNLQLNEEIGLITYKDINSGSEKLNEMLADFKRNNIRIIVADGKTEENLEELLLIVNSLDFSVSWAGSAGLTNYLPKLLNIEPKRNTFQIKNSKKPSLTIVGSININSRTQLDYLLKHQDVNSIEIRSERLVSSKNTNELEIQRVLEYLIENAKNGKDTVIYTSDNIDEAREIGNKNELNNNQVSKEIVKAVGKITEKIINREIYGGMTITGGDTLKQVAKYLKVSGFQLYDELQIGVPITTFKEKPDFYCVTKAGGFGSENIFVEANNKFKGA